MPSFSASPETPRLRLFCALLTAVLWWQATLPSGLFALGWIAPLPLLWSLHGLDARQRLRAGWRCGFFSFALINWWIVVAITRGAPFIGVPQPLGFLLGLLGAVLIGLIHGFLVALVALAWDSPKFSQSSTRWLMLWPLGLAALWMILDILRCETPLAHSWGALAYTQWRDVALLQTASVIGQHGLTFVCVWFAASLALWLRAAQAGQKSAILWRAPLLVMLVLHLWGMARIGRVENRSGEKPRILRVLLVQTTTGDNASGDNASGDGRSSFAQAFDMTFRAARRGQVDLVVWPETTFQVKRRNVKRRNVSPGATSDVKTTGEQLEIGRDVEGLEVRQLDELARLTRTPILTGADVSIEGGARSNQALLFEGTGQIQSRAKNHLVPFGERAPWSETLPFLRALAPTPQIEPGTGTEPIVFKDRVLERVAIGTLICFESCFQQPSRGLRRNGARALFVLTNDDLFRGSEAPWQHAAMSALRAVENGVPVAQSANGGYTFAVDQWGRFMVKSTFDVPQTVQVSLVLN